MSNTPIIAGFRAFREVAEFGIMFRWPDQQSESGGSGTRMPSPVFVRYRRCAGFSATPRRVLSLCDGAQKNALWGVWSSTPGLVRPTRAMGPGPCLRRPAHLLGSGSATRVLPALRQGEARTAGLPGRQSVLHQALCLLRGSALSLGDGQGHRRGASSGLGDGQRAGQAVHARPTRPHANPWAEGHRHRRDLDPQRSRLSDRGQRPAPRPCDLVPAVRTASRRA